MIRTNSCPCIIVSILLRWVSDRTNSELVQLFKDLNVTADQKKFFKKALNTYYDAVAELLQSEHAVTALLYILVLPSFVIIFFTFLWYLLWIRPNYALSPVSSSDGGRECKSFNCQRWTKRREHCFVWKTPEVFWSFTTWCILVSIHLRVLSLIYLYMVP
jgi:hypothetical protein